MLVELTITPEDVFNGFPSSPTEDATSQSLKRLVAPNVKFFVQPEYVFFLRHDEHEAAGVTVELPQALTDFIYVLDLGMPHETTETRTFQVDIPTEYLNEETQAASPFAVAAKVFNVVEQAVENGEDPEAALIADGFGPKEKAA